MANEVYALNEVSGVVALVPVEYLTHPIFGPNLKPVRNGKTRKRLSEIVREDTPETDTETKED